MVLRAVSLFCFAVSAAASVALVWQQLSGAALPGCGLQSGCASLAESSWGNILGIPLSHVGVAYFAAATLALWFVNRSHSTSPKISPVLAAVLIVGSAGSVFYLGLMGLLGRWCGYCAAVHCCNLLGSLTVIASRFVSAQKVSPDHAKASGVRSTALPLACFLFLLVCLSVADRVVRQSIRQQQAENLEQSLQQVLSAEDGAVVNASKGFYGRHHVGPATAVARLVLFFDYQCGDCAELEREVTQIRKQHPSVAVSVRQFPLCSECNPSIPYPWFHPRACDAARLAEAVGMIGGEDAFWATHDWLFERKAKFEPDEVDTLSKSLNLDPHKVRGAMQSPSVARILQEDIDEGIAVGVSETPFVFLNGIELEGIAADPTKIRDAIERVVSENERRIAKGETSLAATFQSDPRPPAADDRVLKLWETAEPAQSLPPQGSELVQLGNPDGTHRVILFQEPTYADAQSMWNEIDKLAKMRSDVSIEFYLYPMNGQDNPDLPEWQQKLYPHSAITSRMIAALTNVDLIGRIDRVFEFASNADPDLTPDAMYEALAGRIGAVRMGPRTMELSGDEWKRRANSKVVSDLIKTQIQLAKTHQVSWGPTLIINGHLSPTDRVTAELLSRMLDIPPGVTNSTTVPADE